MRVSPQAEPSEPRAAERDPLLESFRQATIAGHSASTERAKAEPSSDASAIDLAAEIAAGLIPPTH